MPRWNLPPPGSIWVNGHRFCFSSSSIAPSSNTAGPSSLTLFLPSCKAANAFQAAVISYCQCPQVDTTVLNRLQWHNPQVADATLQINYCQDCKQSDNSVSAMTIRSRASIQTWVSRCAQVTAEHSVSRDNNAKASPVFYCYWLTLYILTVWGGSGTDDFWGKPTTWSGKPPSILPARSLWIS